MKIKEEENKKKKKKKKKDELSIYLLMFNNSTCRIELKNANDKSKLRKYIKKTLKILKREEEEIIPL